MKSFRTETSCISSLKIRSKKIRRLYHNIIDAFSQKETFSAFRDSKELLFSTQGLVILEPLDLDRNLNHSLRTTRGPL
jgi:hypothetical protein